MPGLRMASLISFPRETDEKGTTECRTSMKAVYFATGVGLAEAI